jgi:isopropylmalate/homocitrate/citramalate synthase
MENRVREELKLLDERRKRELERIREYLKDGQFDLERWEELRRIVYKPVPLRIDVVVDDCTLREGLQMAGLIIPKPEDSCKIACMLRDIGVERLEVMTYTKADQQAIKLMKDNGLGDMLAGWCRAAREDVDLALKLDLKQVGISHPVSFIHFEKWMDRPLEQLVNRVVDTVSYAVQHGLTVFVHGEDSTRADWEFERIFINAVAEAGAKVYRICDTVGVGLSDPSATLPNGIPAKVMHIKRETKIPYVEIHAHDDLGNAVENTMSTIRAAAGLYDKVYVSTTFLGLGDRAGNAETEKVIMNCYFHHDIRKWNLKPLRELALFVASALKYHLPLNKALVGDGAFAHESGIHVHGIKSLPLTYEVFPPELVGQQRTIMVGPRSGKHGIHLKLEQLMGKKVDENDPRLVQLVELVKSKYTEGGRRTPIKDDEFRELARKVGFEL